MVYQADPKKSQSNTTETEISGDSSINELNQTQSVRFSSEQMHKSGHALLSLDK